MSAERRIRLCELLSSGQSETTENLAAQLCDSLAWRGSKLDNSLKIGRRGHEKAPAFGDESFDDETFGDVCKNTYSKLLHGHIMNQISMPYVLHTKLH